MNHIVKLSEHFHPEMLHISLRSIVRSLRFLMEWHPLLLEPLFIELSTNNEKIPDGSQYIQQACTESDSKAFECLNTLVHPIAVKVLTSLLNTYKAAFVPVSNMTSVEAHKSRLAQSVIRGEVTFLPHEEPKVSVSLRNPVNQAILLMAVIHESYKTAIQYELKNDVPGSPIKIQDLPDLELNINPQVVQAASVFSMITCSQDDTGQIYAINPWFEMSAQDFMDQIIQPGFNFRQAYLHAVAITLDRIQGKAVIPLAHPDYQQSVTDVMAWRSLPDWELLILQARQQHKLGYISAGRMAADGVTWQVRPVWDSERAPVERLQEPYTLCTCSKYLAMFTFPDEQVEWDDHSETDSYGIRFAENEKTPLLDVLLQRIVNTDHAGVYRINSTGTLLIMSTIQVSLMALPALIKNRPLPDQHKWVEDKLGITRIADLPVGADHILFVDYKAVEQATRLADPQILAAMSKTMMSREPRHIRQVNAYSSIVLPVEKDTTEFYSLQGEGPDYSYPTDAIIADAKLHALFPEVIPVLKATMPEYVIGIIKS